jgi:hypothetical protein
MLVGLVIYVINLSAILDLAVNMELAFDTQPVETTFVFVSLVGKAILVTDAYLIGNVHNPITLMVFQHVSIQMTVSVQHPVYLIQKDFVAMKN